MSVAELLRWQWDGYARYHSTRSNLLLHVIFVPLFLVGNVVLLVMLLHGSWMAAVGGAVTMAVSVLLQSRGHGREPTPPEPFTGARNALARIVLEQWVTFPRFVASGGWLRAFGHGGPVNPALHLPPQSRRG